MRSEKYFSDNADCGAHRIPIFIPLHPEYDERNYQRTQGIFPEPEYATETFGCGKSTVSRRGEQQSCQWLRRLFWIAVVLCVVVLLTELLNPGKVRELWSVVAGAGASAFMMNLLKKNPGKPPRSKPRPKKPKV